jgi:hypothetical protein
METENFAQLGDRSAGNTSVLVAAITQMLSLIATMQRTLHKLIAMQESQRVNNVSSSVCSCTRTPSSAGSACDVIVDAHSLLGCFYNWYTLELWHTATQKKHQFIRSDLKASVNIMIIAAGRNIDVPSAPLHRDGAAYQLWKQALWTLAEDLDMKANAALGSIDGKGQSKTAGSLRKRWRKLRVDHRPANDSL